ncbi:hypothetical protein KP509_37G023500 [Ceratopteris richardii]|uniref:Magnesium transporter n=1 Tax=Ceratopteris richardii TaxID=49495 RepID=A0A8T2Q7C6_CERRI|nr:hypothetical protein KP509_37G023500 [Ceratopteris richardii]
MGKVAALRDRLTDRPSYVVLDGKADSQAVQINTFVKKKKKPDTRLWMRLLSEGDSELLELDRHTLTQLVSIPARDLRILGPVFSQSSAILAREKAMVVNLEFIKAIVTAQEVFILDPTSAAVNPFINQLKGQLRTVKAGHNNQELMQRKTTEAHDALSGPDFTASKQDELPFEFRVLEVALDTVCGFLEKEVKDLECNAYPVLDELTRNVSTRNLELVRSLKSDLTRLLSRIQKVRDEMEHLLDDDKDMADLYLTRKLALSQLDDFNSLASPANSPRVSYLNSRRSSNASYAGTVDDHNVEQLEMLLEAYFVQVDSTQKKILAKMSMLSPGWASDLLFSISNTSRKIGIHIVFFLYCDLHDVCMCHALIYRTYCHDIFLIFCALNFLST